MLEGLKRYKLKYSNRNYYYLQEVISYKTDF
jgi:hypothetical protein